MDVTARARDAAVISRYNTEHLNLILGQPICLPSAMQDTINHHHPVTVLENQTLPDKQLLFLMVILCNIRL